MKFKIFGILIIIFTTVSAQTVYGTFGEGLIFIPADSSFSMQMNLRMQNLYEGEYYLQSDKFESGFLVRRARLKFGGHAYTPKVTYKIELGLSNSDLSINNEDGNVGNAARIIFDMVFKYQFKNHWSIWVGQTKLPGNRERVVSSGSLQFVDRSFANRFFNLDRDLGLQLYGNYTIGKQFIIKPIFSFSQGEGRNITTGNKGGYCYTGRLDFLPFGDFDDYVLSDLERQSAPKLSLGFTYNLNHKTVRQQGQLGKYIYELDNLGNKLRYVQERSLSSVQTDFIFKYKGFSSLNEVIYTTLINHQRTSLTPQFNLPYNTGIGINSQIGYLFVSNFEIAGRFTSIIPYGISPSSGINDVEEWTLCFSKYFSGHNLKIQTDASWIALNNTQESIRIRTQLEMQF